MFPLKKNNKIEKTEKEFISLSLMTVNMYLKDCGLDFIFLSYEDQIFIKYKENLIDITSYLYENSVMFKRTMNMFDDIKTVNNHLEFINKLIVKFIPSDFESLSYPSINVNNTKSNFQIPLKIYLKDDSIILTCIINNHIYLVKDILFSEYSFVERHTDEDKRNYLLIGDNLSEHFVFVISSYSIPFLEFYASVKRNIFKYQLNLKSF